MRNARKPTEYGKAVRKYRIDTGKTTKEMADYLDCTVSYLSAVEVGNKEVTESLLDNTIKFFKKYGVDASDLKSKALLSKRSLEMTWEDFSIDDKQIALSFARTLPEMTASEKQRLKKILNMP